MGREAVRLPPKSKRTAAAVVRFLLTGEPLVRDLLQHPRTPIPLAHNLLRHLHGPRPPFRDAVLILPKRVRVLPKPVPTTPSPVLLLYPFAPPPRDLLPLLPKPPPRARIRRTILGNHCIGFRWHAFYALWTPR